MRNKKILQQTRKKCSILFHIVMYIYSIYRFPYASFEFVVNLGKLLWLSHFSSTYYHNEVRNFYMNMMGLWYLIFFLSTLWSPTGSKYARFIYTVHAVEIYIGEISYSNIVCPLPVRMGFWRLFYTEPSMHLQDAYTLFKRNSWYMFILRV